MNPNFKKPIKRLWFAVAATLLITGCSDNKVSTALGTLERDRIALQSVVSEVITEVLAVEGSEVKQGQVLLRFDDQKQQTVVMRSVAEVKQAQAYLEQLRNGAREEDIAAARAEVEAIDAQLTDASKAFDRTEVLVDKNVQREADLDTARARRDALAANLLSVREKLRLLENGTRPEQITQAEAALEKTSASLKLEQEKLKDYTIIATRDGWLDSLPRHAGERVSTGTTVAVLLAEGTPYARVYIPEQARVSLSVGDALNIKVDGIEQPYVGKLRWISLEPAYTPHYALNQKERARLVYLAEVQLPDSTGLPTGIPVQVELPL